MKVWVVCIIDYTDVEVVGAFTVKEKAVEAAEQSGAPGSWSITECSVDEPVVKPEYL